MHVGIKEKRQRKAHEGRKNRDVQEGRREM